MAEAQDVDTLKRRGRRRLVGAVALVLLAVIVLPMVFDPEPSRPAPPVSVRIPGEDETTFAPKMTAKAPEKKAEAPKPEPKLEAKAEPKAEPKPEPKADKAAERARAEAALANAEYVVTVGSFANPKNATERLSAAKIPYFTEKVANGKATLTRIQAGPFATKKTADEARQKLIGLGFKPGGVAAKS